LDTITQPLQQRLDHDDQNMFLSRREPEQRHLRRTRHQFG
jgi:hypothetical protein